MKVNVGNTIEIVEAVPLLVSGTGRATYGLTTYVLGPIDFFYRSRFKAFSAAGLSIPPYNHVFLGYT